MPERRQHSACDECRRRKLKCSGEMPACLRCQEEQINCVYSQQKTMGRPRKRPRGDDSNAIPQSSVSNEAQTAFETTFPVYEGWTLPPTDIAHRHDEELQMHCPQTLAASGADSTGAIFNFDPWEAEACVHTPALPHLRGSPNNFSSSDSDTVPASTQYDDINAETTANGIGVSNYVTCTCLSGMYLAASNMEATRHSGFPNALTALRAGLDTARGILICNKCVKEAVSGCQNFMLLQSMLQTMAGGFDKLLKDIDAEADRAAAESETKTICTGDNSPETMHLHTGTHNCPGRFNIELEPDEWRKITKRLVKKSIFGQSAQLQTLESLVDATEARQKAWHYAGFPRMPPGLTQFPEEKDWMCLRMNNQVRSIIAEMAE